MMNTDCSEHYSNLSIGSDRSKVGPRFKAVEGGAQRDARLALTENAEAVAALVALLEPLDRWISVTRGESHRAALVLAYARAVPADATLVFHLYEKSIGRADPHCACAE